MSDYFVHDSTYVDSNVRIGDGTKIWHFSHIMSGSTIGEKCNIGQNVVISPEVILGSGVKVQNNVSLYTGVTCEDNVFIGPSVVFTNVINPRSAIERKQEYRSTNVGTGASLGANSTIICGVNIGSYSMIGAGAVVTKDVPPFALVVGNPAKQIGWVSAYGHTLNLDQNGKACCPESGQLYQLVNQELVKIS